MDTCSALSKMSAIGDDGSRMKGCTYLGFEKIWDGKSKWRCGNLSGRWIWRVGLGQG